MTIADQNIAKIARKAGLEIISNRKTTSVHQRLFFTNVSTYALLFFLFGGIFLISIPFLHDIKKDYVSAVLVILLGLLMFVFSVLAILKQRADYVAVGEKALYGRYNLTAFSIPKTEIVEIKMRTEVTKSRRGYWFIHVKHYVQLKDREMLVLNFQKPYSEADEANSLGSYINRLLNEKMND